ncbi:Cyclin N domain containing protein [Trichuris trichiura]|uniref:Cyclin N domain containing protein n=1 Tax=Trichuris trichiura TaxID=36087 RepID=A0A077ZF77_TRITR|nr:Cyclin N domain containing protein [Trichuris trichiura]
MYSMSTHKKFWTFENQKKLDELRREARKTFIKKLIGSTETESAQKALLTVDEERMFRSMVEENALKFCRSFEPPLPTRVIYTAFVHFKRFYLNASLLRYLNAKNIMTAIIYLASKIEDSYIPIETFVSKLKSGRPEDNVAMIRNLEPILIKRLCSQLVVHEPFTPLEGFYILLMVSVDYFL